MASFRYWNGDPPYLVREYLDQSGYTHQSRLNLDECIGNINGGPSFHLHTKSVLLQH